MPPEHLLAEMAAYHGELAKAGVLVDGNGLQATSKGWRVRYRGAGRTVVDGPFAETKELIAGYTIINVKSRAEAVEWTRKFPNPTLDGSDCEIEVRQMFELEDFGESETLDRFREIGHERRAGEAAMKFVCLGCLDKEAWGRLSVGEQAALVVECTNFDQELAAKGHFAGGLRPAGFRQRRPPCAGRTARPRASTARSPRPRKCWAAS